MLSKPFLLALAAAASCLAQNTTLRGQVTNSMTGEPVVRAHVVLFNQSRKYGAYTDATGNFSFENVVPDSYQTTAERMGFKTRVSLPDSDSGFLKLLPGAQIDSIKVHLVPLGSVSGRVVDANGEPMEGVSVMAQRGFAETGQAKTDETGRFRIAGLVPGRFRIKAEKGDLPVPPEIRTDGTSEVHYGTTWYPGVLDAKSGTKVEVRPGSETSGLGIRMLAVPIVGIRGRIEGLPAGAKDVAVMVIHPGVWNANPDTEIASNGRFEVWRLDPGHYRVFAMGSTIPGHEFQTIPEEVDIAGSNIDNLVLTVVPLIDIDGRLGFEDTGAKEKFSKPMVVLNDPDGAASGSRPAQMLDGESFRLQRLPASRYRVSVGEGVYVKSIRLGQTETDGSLLDLRHAPSGADLVLTVSATMGRIAGTVHDEKGTATKASIALIPDDDQPAVTGSFSFSFGVTPTKDDGTYQLDGVAPGKYKLVAVDRSEDIDVSDYDDSAEEIEVRAGEEISKDLTCQHTE